MNQLIAVLEEMIVANQNCSDEFYSNYWRSYVTDTNTYRSGVTGAVMKHRGLGGLDRIGMEYRCGMHYANLEELFLKEARLCFVHSAIEGPDAYKRKLSAKCSNFFTKEELKHPHLTKDHNDRTVAVSFVQLCLDKIKARQAQLAS